MADKITNETFNTVMELVRTPNCGVEAHEIIDLMIEELGIDRNDASKIVKMAVEIGKQQVKNEVKKQTENMIYWVNQR